MAISWHRIKRSRRVIVHVPSLGYNQRVTDSLNEFGAIQNAQMARLCDIKGKKYHRAGSSSIEYVSQLVILLAAHTLCVVIAGALPYFSKIWSSCASCIYYFKMLTHFVFCTKYKC